MKTLATLILGALGAGTLCGCSSDSDGTPVAPPVGSYKNDSDIPPEVRARKEHAMGHGTMPPLP